MAQSDAQAGGRSIDELDARSATTAWWPSCGGSRAQGFGAGEVHGADRARAVCRAGARAGRGRPLPDGRLRLHEAIVSPSWIDYNGHMTESRYLEVLADATDAFLRRIGIDQAYVDSGRSYYTVETHIRHLGEAHAGERLYVASRLLGHDAKRLHLFHELRRAGDDVAGRHRRAHAAARRPRRRAHRSGGARSLAALRRIADAQRGLAWPTAAGGRIEVSVGARVTGAVAPERPPAPSDTRAGSA